MSLTVTDQTAPVEPVDVERPSRNVIVADALRYLANLIERADAPLPGWNVSISGALENADEVQAAAKALGATYECQPYEDEIHHRANLAVLRRNWRDGHPGITLRLTHIVKADPVAAAVLTPDAPELPADPEVAMTGEQLAALAPDLVQPAEPVARMWDSAQRIPADVTEVADCQRHNEKDFLRGTWRRVAEGGWRFHSETGGHGLVLTETEMKDKFGPVTEVRHDVPLAKRTEPQGTCVDCGTPIASTDPDARCDADAALTYAQRVLYEGVLAIADGRTHEEILADSTAAYRWEDIEAVRRRLGLPDADRDESAGVER